MIVKLQPNGYLLSDDTVALKKCSGMNIVVWDKEHADQSAFADMPSSIKSLAIRGADTLRPTCESTTHCSLFIQVGKLKHTLATLRRLGDMKTRTRISDGFVPQRALEEEESGLSSNFLHS